ncbi:glycosyltransferase 87 family protein [Adhaeribacter aquaticus]|uniref:glycosyltransferase 87 family protein n=1 Tax=Adhaeribacter aquaticus TaxID=299567 RepID=UPI00041737B1|nr:glycosyltransferase 87 family protein [Adhaeribacter aquaticus]
MLTIFQNRNTWIYFICAISLVLLVGELINGRLWMHDLEVYYKTASRIVKGQALYRIAEDGHYVFKYSPTAGIYFIPFLVVPFSIAKIIYWVLLTLFTILGLRQLYCFLNEKSLELQAAGANAIILLSFLVVGAHLHREWHLGQVNLVLLLIYILLIKSIIARKSRLTGLLLGFSLFLKPFGLIFFPYLIFKKQFKAVIWTLLFLLLLGLLPFVFYPSVKSFEHLYGSWIEELAIELGAKQDLLASGNHTIFSVLARFTPIHYLLTSPTTIRVYQLVVVALIGLSMLWFLLKGKQLANNIFPELAILISLIPLFAFTSYNAFLFAMPCVIFLLYYFATFSVGERVLIIVGCVLIGGNIRDLTGSGLFKMLEANSVYTFGTVLLIVMMFIYRLKHAPRSR